MVTAHPIHSLKSQGGLGIEPEEEPDSATGEFGALMALKGTPLSGC